MSSIHVTATIDIDEDELEFSFVRSSGPGGQHVNKASTCAQLRFDAMGSENLPSGAKRRLRDLAGNQITDSGEIVIESSATRSQKQNRDDALDKLLTLIRQAARPPKKRKRTRPTLASKKRRLRGKKHRGEIKRLRKPPKRDR
jgi:ribosome-associated protein